METHIWGCVLDQDHLASLLSGHEPLATEIQARLVSLIEQRLVELYTYPQNGSDIHVLSLSEAMEVVLDMANWVWKVEAQPHFLSPVKLPNGLLAYDGQVPS